MTVLHKHIAIELSNFKTTYLQRRQGQFQSRPADTLQAIQNEYAHKSQSAPHRVPGQFATQND